MQKLPSFFIPSLGQYQMVESAKPNVHKRMDRIRIVIRFILISFLINASYLQQYFLYGFCPHRVLAHTGWPRFLPSLIGGWRYPPLWISASCYLLYLNYKAATFPCLLPRGGKFWGRANNTVSHIKMLLTASGIEAPFQQHHQG